MTSSNAPSLNTWTFPASPIFQLPRWEQQAVCPATARRRTFHRGRNKSYVPPSPYPNVMLLPSSMKISNLPAQECSSKPYLPQHYSPEQRVHPFRSHGGSLQQFHCQQRFPDRTPPQRFCPASSSLSIASSNSLCTQSGGLQGGITTGESNQNFRSAPSFHLP